MTLYLEKQRGLVDSIVSFVGTRCIGNGGHQRVLNGAARKPGERYFSPSENRREAISANRFA